MEAKFSNRVKEVISLSREEALRLGHDYIGTEHLILGMIREGEGVAVGVLKKLGVPLDELRNEIEKISKGTATHQIKNLANIPLTKASEKVLKITYLEAKIFKAQLIGTEHLLLSILRDQDNLGTQILNKFDVNYETVKEMLEYQNEGPIGFFGSFNPTLVRWIALTSFLIASTWPITLPLNSSLMFKSLLLSF